MLLLDSECCQTGVTEFCVSFVEVGIEGHAFVEDEAITLVVFATAFFEVLQNAAVELIDVFEASLFHERACFFTADAARAERDDRRVFQRVGQLVDRFWKVPEVIHADR